MNKYKQDSLPTGCLSEGSSVNSICPLAHHLPSPPSFHPYPNPLPPSSHIQYIENTYCFPANLDTDGTYFWKKKLGSIAVCKRSFLATLSYLAQIHLWCEASSLSNIESIYIEHELIHYRVNLAVRSFPFMIFATIDYSNFRCNLVKCMKLFMVILKSSRL